MAALSAGTSLTVAGADWESIGRDATGIAYEIDYGGVTHFVGPYWRAWMRADATKADPRPNFASAKYLHEVNCEAATIRTLNSVRYGAKGEVLGALNTPLSEPEPVVPDSMGETVKRHVCLAALRKGFGEWLEKQKRQ